MDCSSTCNFIMVRIKEFSKDQKQLELELRRECNFVDKKHEGLLGCVWERESN